MVACAGELDVPALLEQQGVDDRKAIEAVDWDALRTALPRWRQGLARFSRVFEELGPAVLEDWAELFGDTEALESATRIRRPAG